MRVKQCKKWNTEITETSLGEPPPNPCYLSFKLVVSPSKNQQRILVFPLLMLMLKLVWWGNWWSGEAIDDQGESDHVLLLDEELMVRWWSLRAWWWCFSMNPTNAIGDDPSLIQIKFSWENHAWSPIKNENSPSFFLHPPSLKNLLALFFFLSKLLPTPLLTLQQVSCGPAFLTCAPTWPARLTFYWWKI